MNTKLKMHKIVWVCLGAFTLIVGSFPVAMGRVSEMDKFRGSHLKSWTVQWQVHPDSPSSAQVKLE